MSSLRLAIKVVLLSLSLALWSNKASAQNTLANFGFQVNIPTAGNTGPYAADNGIFAASSTALTNAVGSISSPAGNGSTNSFSASGWGPDRYYQFSTSSLGYAGLSVSYGQAASGTGPRDFQFSYSTDNVNFTPFGAAYDGPDADFSTVTFQSGNVISYNLTGVPALNNAPNLYFRVSVVGNANESGNVGGTIGTGGTFRVDDFVVVATTPVPEPATILGLSTAAIGLVEFVRRRRTAIVR